MAEDVYFPEGDSLPSDPNAPRQVSEARVTDYRVMPWPDGTRVTVELGLSPFKVMPAMEVSILSIEGRVIQTSSMVGAIERRPAPTLHLPKLPPGSKLAVLIEMLDGPNVLQQVIVPFEVGGPIIKQAVQS